MTILALPTDVRQKLQIFAELPGRTFHRSELAEERIVQLSEAHLIEAADVSFCQTAVGELPFRSHYRLTLSCRDQLELLKELEQQHTKQQQQAAAEKELAAEIERKKERKNTRRFWITIIVTFLTSGTGGVLLGSFLNAGKPLLEWFFALFH